MIRHGQGTHNEDSNYLIKKYRQLTVPDTNLTDKGVEQAINAGKALHDILEKNEIKIVDDGTLFLQTKDIVVIPDNQTFLRLFVSDLRRTHQTMVNLLKGLCDSYKEQKRKCIKLQKLSPTSKYYIDPQAIVLPCSHELDFIKKDGICDATQPFAQKLAAENRTCCATYDKVLEGVYPNKSCDLKFGELQNCNRLIIPLDGDNSKNPSLIINWSDYATFYQNDFSRRAFVKFYSSHAFTGPDCSNTSMIAHALAAIIKDITLGYKKPDNPIEQRQPRKKTMMQRIVSAVSRATGITRKASPKSNISNGFVGNYVNAVLKHT